MGSEEKSTGGSGPSAPGLASAGADEGVANLGFAGHVEGRTGTHADSIPHTHTHMSGNTHTGSPTGTHHTPLGAQHRRSSSTGSSQKSFEGPHSDVAGPSADRIMCGMDIAGVLLALNSILFFLMGFISPTILLHIIPSFIGAVLCFSAMQRMRKYTHALRTHTHAHHDDMDGVTVTRGPCSGLELALVVWCGVLYADAILVVLINLILGSYYHHTFENPNIPRGQFLLYAVCSIVAAVFNIVAAVVCCHAAKRMRRARLALAADDDMMMTMLAIRRSGKHPHDREAKRPEGVDDEVKDAQAVDTV